VVEARGRICSAKGARTCGFESLKWGKKREKGTQKSKRQTKKKGGKESGVREKKNGAPGFRPGRSLGSPCEMGEHEGREKKGGKGKSPEPAPKKEKKKGRMPGERGRHGKFTLNQDTPRDYG